VIPRRLLSCCRETIIAAPAMNPIRVAFERKSIINPSLQFNQKTKSKPAIINSRAYQNSFSKYIC
jgi:hypothetical protein